MNDFFRDDEWQKHMRDKILAPQFYRQYSTEGRYVFIDKGRLATILQRRFAVDTIAQGRAGNAACIEEKIVRWPRDRHGRLKDQPYKAFTLETNSCTVPGHESDGWMVYGAADWLLYCFANQTETALTCYLIDFPVLKEWFWRHADDFPVFQMQTKNRTRGRVVPILDVMGGITPTPKTYFVEQRDAA